MITPTVNVFLTVSKYLSDRPMQWVTAAEIREQIPEEFKEQFSLASIGAEMGSLKDWGKVAVAGNVGESGRSARWDAG